MPRILERFARQVLMPFNTFPTALTDKDEIEGLVKRLHPVSAGVELVRLGPEGDGGYLVPNDLVGIEACFSPGVGHKSRFEKDCADHGMQVFLADGSVEAPAVAHQEFNFTRKHIGATTSSEFMTVDGWVESSLPGLSSDLLLQIDIEGSEYETFLSMSKKLMQRLRIIVAEFHFLELFWSRPFFGIASRAFEKILETHSCVHIHPNNNEGALNKGGLTIPYCMEFTFLRNDRIKGRSYAQVFPHPLDSDNYDKPSLALPECWYKASAKG